MKTKNNQLKKISQKNKIKIKSQKMTQMLVVEPSKRSPSSLSNRSFICVYCKEYYRRTNKYLKILTTNKYELLKIKLLIYKD